MSNFSRWQSGTALLVVLGMTAGAATPIVMPAPTFAPPANFTDVPSGYWAEGFIEALAAKEIIKGFPDGRFRPDAPVTRAEFAAMLLKAFKQPKVNGDITFVDVPQKYWAKSAIQEANRTGFLRGYPGNVFRPNENIPRVQILVSLVSGLNYAAGSSTPTTLQVYRDVAAIPDFARDKVAAATEKSIVVNQPDIKILNPRGSATRAEVAASIYQALVSVGKATAISSPYIVGYPPRDDGSKLQAKDVTLETPSGKPVTIAVLKNDTTPQETSLTVSGVTNGSNGSVAIATDKRRVIYTPNPGFSGPTDTFSYTISDGKGETTTAKITLKFQASQLQAKADTAETLSGKPVTIQVLENDTPTEDTSLTISQVTKASNGSVAIAADKKSVTYTPNPGVASVTDNFNYTISNEQGGTATAKVTVKVGPSPLAAKDDTAATSSGKPVTIAVLTNDMPAKGTSLTVTDVTNGSNGSVAIAADKKRVIYTPDPGFSGPKDTFSYTITNEQGKASTATVTVTFTTHLF
jgi:lipopolysaccharide export system protein LptA